jgi:hypothetical protein
MPERTLTGLEGADKYNIYRELMAFLVAHIGTANACQNGTGGVPKGHTLKSSEQ